MYKDGPATKAFRLEIQNGPSYRYRDNIVQFNAKKGEWTEFEGTYTVPESVTCEGQEWTFNDDFNRVFIETPWSGRPTKENDLMDYYLDDLSISYENGDSELAVNGDAEKGTEGWTTYEHETGKNENLKIVETKDSHSGKKAVKVVNRSLTNDGFGQKFEKEFKEGYTYKFSAWVKQDQVDKQFIAMSIRRGEGENFTNIDTKEVKKGEWVELSGEYTFTEDDDRSVVSVYFETPWKSAKDTKESDIIDITADDLSIIELAKDESEEGKDYRTSSLKAAIESPEEVLGVINQEFDAKIKLDKLEKKGYKNLKLIVALPDKVSVDDVEFNKDAISGDTEYKVEDGNLVLNVKGDDVAFSAEDGSFATLKLKLNGYVRKDTEAKISILKAHVDDGKNTFYEVKDAKKKLLLTYLDTGAIAKKLGCSNPLYTQEFGADPYAIVYNDRVYVYMTADDYEYDSNGKLKDNSFGYIKTLRVISSSDMVNWTDHGTMKIAGSDGPAKWASHSWAPAIAHKVVDGKDKFFLYFANDGSGIGVVESDSPIGPWKDPIGGYLLNRKVPGCEGVEWCFDPAVLVDDDGSAYIYFGGGIPNNGANGEAYNPHTARVAKLGDDMISISGTPIDPGTPYLFEDSSMRKYYYNYCTNFMNHSKEGYPGNGNIAYMVSDSPMGPFKYAGEIFDNPATWFGVGGNNHHATFVFRGKSYFLYHAQTVAKELGTAKGYRSTHIDKLEFDEDGNILPVKGTYEGISQLESLDPYKTIEAETIAWNKGIKVADIDGSNANRELTSVDDGDWTSVAGADFGDEGTDKFTARVKSEKGGSIEVRLDSPQGSLIGTVEVPEGTDEYTDISTEITKITGERNVFFVFKGDGKDLMTIDSYIFGDGKIETPEKPSPSEDPAVDPEKPGEDPGHDDPIEDPEKPGEDDPTEPEKPGEDDPAEPEKPGEDDPAEPEKPGEDDPTVDPDQPGEKPSEEKKEDPTKPVSEPAARASAGNGKTSTADQIAAPGDTTTLLAAESGKVTINASAKKLVLEGDKGSFKITAGKGVKVSKKGKLTIRKKCTGFTVSFTAGGKEVTKTVTVEQPKMPKKVKAEGGSAAITLEGTDISTAVWTSNKPKEVKISVSKDGRHVLVTRSKKGKVKVTAQINGRNYTTTVIF